MSSCCHPRIKGDDFCHVCGFIYPQKTQKTKEKKGFTCGVGYSIALLAREGYTGEAEMLLEESNFSMEDFRKSGVNAEDLAVIRPLRSEILRRAMLRRAMY